MRLEEAEANANGRIVEPLTTRDISWGSPREGVVLCLSPNTLRKTLRIAVIVGTLLSLINQGHVVAAGEASAVTWLQILANYFIPWVVSSVGFLSASRRGPASTTAARAVEEQAGDEDVIAGPVGSFDVNVAQNNNFRGR